MADQLQVGDIVELTAADPDEGREACIGCVGRVAEIRNRGRTLEVWGDDCCAPRMADPAGTDPCAWEIAHGDVWRRIARVEEQ